MAIELTRDQIIDCLHRQLVNPFVEHHKGCGIGCDICKPAEVADCSLVGFPDQFDNYQALLRDPAIPQEKAQPLIDALENEKRYCEEYDEFAPEPMPLFQAVYDLVMEYL